MWTMYGEWINHRRVAAYEISRDYTPLLITERAQADSAGHRSLLLGHVKSATPPPPAQLTTTYVVIECVELCHGPVHWSINDWTNAHSTYGSAAYLQSSAAVYQFICGDMICHVAGNNNYYRHFQLLLPPKKIPIRICIIFQLNSRSPSDKFIEGQVGWILQTTCPMCTFLHMCDWDQKNMQSPCQREI